MNPTGAEGSAVFTVVWWIVAAMSVIAALLVVQLRDLLKAALALVVAFLGVAALFVMLNAEFLAAAQVLIYAGAISILIIFAILLTRDVQRGNPSNRFRTPAWFLSALLLALMVFVIVATNWRLLRHAALTPQVQARAAEVYSNSTPWLGRLLVRDFVLPFEVASVLLLAALIGAIVLVRER
ncbi:MAG: NADH-quinone oxidoreductase subunit J [Chloroflexi bacterium]|nr:NADH-quinone oxidoreductase subunit J [Chloroflexota bacterium]